jgi:hypothetical protein
MMTRASEPPIKVCLVGEFALLLVNAVITHSSVIGALYGNRYAVTIVDKSYIATEIVTVK